MQVDWPRGESAKTSGMESGDGGRGGAALIARISLPRAAVDDYTQTMT